MTSALIGFNAAAVALTLFGGAVPLKALSRAWMLRLFSLRSGVLLAVAFTEVLPKAWAHHPAAAGWGALLAFAALFSLESLAMGDSCPEYLEGCSVHLLGWTALAALFIHSFIDGFNLSLSFSAGALAGAVVGTALAVHKLVDGFTLTSLLVQAGYAPRGAWAALVLIALATPLGSALSLWKAAAPAPGVLGGLLGFAAGSFVYIGAADILPRLHRRDARDCLLFFACGMAVMILLGHSH